MAWCRTGTKPLTVPVVTKFYKVKFVAQLPVAHVMLISQVTPIWHQGWGQVLFEVLESSTSTFHICKYKYSEYLEDTKYIKYFFNQVQVKYKYFGNKQ